jgi:hypothetical protein|tara:strand:+ start:2098 stop:2436 length:339 start_codon:yes stop_codon:yes gene_type:complete
MSENKTKVERRKTLGFRASKEVLAELAKDSVLSGKRRYALILEAVRELDMSKIGIVNLRDGDNDKRSIPFPLEIYEEIINKSGNPEVYPASIVISAALVNRYSSEAVRNVSK